MSGMVEIVAQTNGRTASLRTKVYEKYEHITVARVRYVPRMISHAISCK
jgi:hypothetical protein